MVGDFRFLAFAGMTMLVSCSGLWDMSVMTGQGMVLLFTVGLIVLFPSRGHA